MSSRRPRGEENVCGEGDTWFYWLQLWCLSQNRSSAFFTLHESQSCMTAHCSMSTQHISNVWLHDGHSINSQT